MAEVSRQKLENDKWVKGLSQTFVNRGAGHEGKEKAVDILVNIGALAAEDLGILSPDERERDVYSSLRNLAQGLNLIGRKEFECHVSELENTLTKRQHAGAAAAAAANAGGTSCPAATVVDVDSDTAPAPRRVQKPKNRHAIYKCRACQAPVMLDSDPTKYAKFSSFYQNYSRKCKACRAAAAQTASE